MLHAAVYTCLRFLVTLLLVRRETEQQRELELLVLRHQLAILRRQVKRPELTTGDRLILAAIGRNPPSASLLFSPATILRWHRKLVRRRWAAFGQRARRGRPPIPAELQDIILMLHRRRRGKRRWTVGGDKGYDTKDFVRGCRDLEVTSHVAQNINPQHRSAIDGRTVTHLGYAVSQRLRKRVEEIFGWWKTVAGGRKLRYIGRRKNQLWAELTSTAFNLVRLANLTAQAA